MVCSTRPLDPRLELNRSLICSTEGTTCGPTRVHHVVAVPSTSVITDVSRSMISFCFGWPPRRSRLPPSPPRTAPAIASATD